MDLLITKTTVVSGGTDGHVLRNGAVAIRGDRIAEVGGSESLEARYGDLPRLELADRALMPGLINCHTHTVLTSLRGAIEDMEFGRNIGIVVYGYMLPISYGMSDDERRAFAALGCLEAIRSGTTTMVDTWVSVASYAEAMADTGLRLYLSESAADAVWTEIWPDGYRYDRGWGEASLRDSLELIEGYHDTRAGRVKCMVAAHAPDTCSPWMLRQLAELADARGLGRTIHLAQSQQEMEQVSEARGGRTSAQYLRDEGWIGRDVLAAHWSLCDASDIAFLAEANTSMAHCVASSSRRGFHRLADMPALFDAGVNVTLGTDNMSEDMFDALRIGVIINRGLRGDVARPTPQEVLTWPTLNAARALGRDDLGSIEAGKKADLTVVRLDRPHLTPMLSIVPSLVHYGQASDVESVMVDGEWIMRDGKVLTMDEAATMQAAQEASESAWRRLKEGWPVVDVPDALRGLIT